MLPFLLRLGDGSHGAELALGALLGRSLAGAALTLGLGLAPLLLPDEQADHLALVGGLLTLHLKDLGLSHEGRLGRRVHGRAAAAGNTAHIVVENIAHQVLIGKEGSRALVVRLGFAERGAAGPRGESTRGIGSGRRDVDRGNVHRPRDAGVRAAVGGRSAGRSRRAVRTV